MTGKSYTLKEMKTIVDYLVDHKAYGEIKGRKMWTDFSNSQLTNRSWQSLKETFLKRILPDIHNPYYKLTMDQVRSFRNGHEVRERDSSNKLEVHTVEDSGSSAENHKDNEQPSTSNYNNEDKTSGEDVNHSQISSHNRASVDTVILDNCCDTVEDVSRDLESPSDGNGKDECSKTQSKSLRDLITYSDPLTPMLQEVLHDFATDEDTDSGEPKMQIVESEQEPEVLGEIYPRKVPQANDNTNKKKENAIENAQDVDESENFVEPKVKSLKLRKRQGVYVPVNDVKPTQKALDDEVVSSKTNKTGSKLPLVEVSEPAIILSSYINEKTVDTLLKSHAQSSQNCSSSTADTVLPNNQEALNEKKLSGTKNTSNGISKDADTLPRKRADSHNTRIANSLNENGNKTKQKQISASDTDVICKKKNIPKIIDNIKKHDDAAKNQTNELQVTKETSVTNTENDTHLTPNKLLSTDDKVLNISTQSSQVNPCLQSMSLFAEQFNNYLESESSDSSVNPVDPPKQPLEEPKIVDKKRVNEVVMLKSHSDTDSDTAQKQTKKIAANSRVLSNTKRDKVLANVFGFSSGAVSKRKRKLSSFRKISAVHHYNGNNFRSESSEWTSESDSDYISPPRRCKNSRSTEKYLKPKSARIHSLEEEGGLFVMYGKRIYPIVKDGKTMKNYAIYSPDSDTDEENYWKMKYMEERKRVDELKKFITKSQRDDERDPSPLLLTNSSRTRTTAQNRRSPSEVVISSDNDKEIVPKETFKHKEPPVDEAKNKTLKITFAKNDQEVHLEGHWSQLHPVLADVVEIFQKDVNTPKDTTVKSILNPPAEPVKEKSPTVLTPIDEEVHEKVNKLETEIFKEIEQKDQEEHTSSMEHIESNVTKRKRTNRLLSTSTVASNSSKLSPSPSRVLKQAKVPKITEEVKPVIDNEMTVTEPDNKEIVTNQDDVIEKGIETPLSVQKSRNTSIASPKKETKTKESSSQSIATKKTRGRPKRSKPVVAVKGNEKSGTDDDETDILYMLPPAKKTLRNSTVSVGKANKSTKKYSNHIPRKFSPSNLSNDSESTQTQGYLDSDVSPPKLRTKKKRRLSLSSILSKNKSKHLRMKRNSYPIITNEASSDSNNSYHIVIKPTNNDCSLKSDVYRSESYQILMPHKRDGKRLDRLEKIQEDDSSSIINCHIKNMNTELIKEKISNNITDDVTLPLAIVNTDGVNSSNISLPLSPEISIVENFNISKDIISTVNNLDTLDEISVNETAPVHNDYLIPQMDVSMTLMQQEFDNKKIQRIFESECTHDDPKKITESESFLNTVNSVNMEEGTSLNVSLDTRLRELLLDSAKKMSMAEENNSGSGEKKEVEKKLKSRRCSTPRKKKETKKTKLALVDPVIEEECMEYCSYGGRKSCPPMLVITTEENAITEDIIFDKEFAVNEKSKGKKKKDVIKVKITRPKAKIQKDDKNRSKVKKANRQSMPVNCQINDNESGISIQDTSDGIDLIHNHSETCLQANECIGDSVEFLEITAKSIISAYSNSTVSCDCKTQQQFDFHDCGDISLFCSNAQDGTAATATYDPVITEATSGVVYHSPNAMSLSSLITEDLSDENPPSPLSTEWYLLGDEDTQTNSHYNSNASNFCSNLKQLFPLTCSVPNLSTITETSKENEENSRKIL